MSSFLGQAVLQASSSSSQLARHTAPRAAVRSARLAPIRSVVADAESPEAAAAAAPQPAAAAPDLLAPPRRRAPIWRAPPSARTRASKEKYFAEQAAIRQEANQKRVEERAGAAAGAGGAATLASKPDRSRFGGGRGGSSATSGGNAAPGSGRAFGTGGAQAGTATDKGGSKGGKGGSEGWAGRGKKGEWDVRPVVEVQRFSLLHCRLRDRLDAGSSTHSGAQPPASYLAHAAAHSLALFSSRLTVWTAILGAASSQLGRLRRDNMDSRASWHEWAPRTCLAHSHHHACHAAGGGRAGWSDNRGQKKEKINIESRRKARQTRREERAEEREANKVRPRRPPGRAR